MTIFVYTAVCEEDSVWVPQYLAEVERLEVPFCIHLDRCGDTTKTVLTTHPLCVGATYRESGEFSEKHKQGVFDLAKKSGADWAMAWDIDETWEPAFKDKVGLLDLDRHEHVDCPWLNLWERKDQVRIDHSFGGGHRVKFYNMRMGLTFKFERDHINGPNCKEKRSEQSKLPICCIHHGMMTHELRVQHKARWDRIYTHHVGGNPYGFWDLALDSTITPVVCPLAERLKEYR